MFSLGNIKKISRFIEQANRHHPAITFTVEALIRQRNHFHTRHKFKDHYLCLTCKLTKNDIFTAQGNETMEIAKKPKLTFFYFGTQIRTCAVKYRWKKFLTGRRDVNCAAGRRAAGSEVCLGPLAAGREVCLGPPAAGREVCLGSRALQNPPYTHFSTCHQRGHLSGVN